MLKRNKGFTLIEILLALAIASIVMLAVMSLSQAISQSVSTATDLSNAQVGAHTTMRQIENKIRNANYLNIENDLPTLNENYIYIYNGPNGISEKTVTTESIMAKNQGDYTQRIDYTKVNLKVIKITVSVLKNDKLVYSLSSEINPNNLIGTNITGAEQGNCISYQASVENFTSVSSIAVISDSGLITTKGQTMQFSATVLPSNATKGEVVWSVSDMAIASIDQEGFLTPLTDGTVEVIATSLDGSGVTGKKQILIENQNPVVIKELTLVTETGQSQGTLKKGGYKMQIIPKITPSGASNKTITWSIENKQDRNYASIDSNGVLTSKYKSGKSVIVSGRTNDGSNLETTIEIMIVN